MNFVLYQSGYDRYSSVPEWARKTLRVELADLTP